MGDLEAAIQDLETATHELNTLINNVPKNKMEIIAAIIKVRNAEIDVWLALRKEEAEDFDRQLNEAIKSANDAIDAAKEYILQLQQPQQQPQSGPSPSN